MDDQPPDYGGMSLAQLRRRVRGGDRGAIEYQRDFARQLGETIEPFRRFAENPRVVVPPPLDPQAVERALRVGRDGVRDAREAKERAEADRHKAMLAELAGMRSAAEREAARADTAEGREREALDLARNGNRLARRNFWVAVVACVITALSLAATVTFAVLA